MAVGEMSLCRWCHRAEVATVAHSAKARWFVENPRSKEIGRLVVCPSCDLLYFDQTYSQIELENMYSGYRGPEYFKRRNKYEPWYTKKVNDAIGHSTEVLRLRQEHLENLLQRAIGDAGLVSPKRVLDIGGDEGQFIPQLTSITDKAVLEVSGVKPVQNVQTISSWDEASAFQPDLVMLCHVLEHTDEASRMIIDTANVLKTGGLMYVEIPLDRPKKVSRVFRWKIYRSYTKWLAQHPLLFRFADLLSLVSRRIIGLPIPFSIIKQNEHINFFSESSLIDVVSAVGFREVSRSTYKPSSEVPIWDVSAFGALFEKI